MFDVRRSFHRVPEASYSSFAARHRIMEMYLAPILILYYFPAEFSRHLYDNARQRRKFSQPEKSFRLLALFFHHRFHRAPKAGHNHPLLPNLRIAASISFLPLPSRSIFFAAPVVAPRHPSSPRLSNIRIFLSMPVSTCSSAGSTKIGRIRNARAKVGRREFTIRALLRASEEFITTASKGISLLSTPIAIRDSIRFSVSGLRQPFRFDFEIYDFERDHRAGTSAEQKLDVSFVAIHRFCILRFLSYNNSRRQITIIGWG